MQKIGLFLLFIIFTIPNAHAFSVEHDFTVLLGPFNASTTKFTYALSPDAYSVNSQVKTSGIFDTIYPFTANYWTNGKIIKNILETSNYHYDSKSRFSKRRKELIYNQHGMPIFRISAKNDKEKKVVIEQDIDNKDTTDLQTVFVELARQYNRVHFCDSRMEVFDGKRRFDVIFKDEGKEELMINEYSPYTGLATKCSMYIDKLGAKDDDLLWELTSDRPIYFWLLEDKTTQKTFIARIAISETPLGRLDVYTKQIKIKD